MKYVWSERVPVGTRLESNLGLTKVRVLRSGTDGKGAWSEERVDVRADYLAAFELASAPTPGGIAVLTDADDTVSSARGDYADFRACRRQPPAGRQAPAIGCAATGASLGSVS